MNQKDYGFAFCLLLLGLFIWLRDTAWTSTAEDTLPILISFPVFYWLGKPWKFQCNLSVPLVNILASIALILAGIILDLTSILAASWTLILWTWLFCRIPKESHSTIKKLLVFPMMAFPWISYDADRLGWWFRISGASVTAHAFSFSGFQVFQEGTFLLINKLPISIEAACAGLNTLQSMLIAGSVMNFLFLGDTNRYWWNIPVLVAMSWAANTLRIIFITTTALITSPAFAMSWFHSIGGLIVIILMFFLCWLIFYLQRPIIKQNL